MILEGNERGYGAELARHLLNQQENDHVTVHAIEGFIADDLAGALAEAAAISQATQCQKYLFSLSLNPPPDADVSVAAFEDAITRAEQKLGLVGQPRAIVFHEKNGRRHAHCVWSRIDPAHLRAINLSHYKRKLCDVSRDLYRLHDWEMPNGFLDPALRDPLNVSRQEAAQAKREKLDRSALKAMFQQCWERSDSQNAFAAALWSEGYALAQGDRRGFVAVDRNGKVWSLSRWCGVKPKAMRERLGSEEVLWSIEEAHAAFATLGPPEAKRPLLTPDATLEHRRMLLVARQRQERDDLKAHQKARRIQEIKARHARLPKGLRAVWAQVTAGYDRLIQAFSAEADKAHARNAQETQNLIERHLAERQALNQQHNQPDLVAELSETFEVAVKLDPRQKLVLPADDVPFSRDQLIQKPALILGYISHKNARFDRTEVLRALAKRIDDPMALTQAAEKAMASSELVRLDNDILTLDGNPAYTTRNYLNAEQALQSAAASMAAHNGFAVSKGVIAGAIDQQNRDMRQAFGGALSEEQCAALNHILGARQLACVVGLAGAGKSTMLKTAQVAWQRQGIRVHGAALAGKAAAGLQAASGIPSRTLASLEASWENGAEPIARGDILVVDEAGMIGTRQMQRVTSKLHEIGAKLVLVGDPEQLQPIEAGRPFEKLIERHGAARLTEIHRQRDAWQRTASRELSAGKINEAVARYDAKGAVLERQSRDLALAALVEAYMTDLEQDGAATSRLALAHRRKDVHAINQTIRATLRLAKPQGDETLFETETGLRAFGTGDRIVFTRNDKIIGVKNGMLGTVKKAHDGKIVVQLDEEDGAGRTINFNPNSYNAFDHGYAVTIHKAQGVTVDQSYVFASRTMDDPLAYVAMTRHRDSMKLFVDQSDRPTWVQVEQTRQNQCKKIRNGPDL